jgi:hypothetical protein
MYLKELNIDVGMVAPRAFRDYISYKTGFIIFRFLRKDKLYAFLKSLQIFNLIHAIKLIKKIL